MLNFYNNFLKLCNSVGKKPSVVAEEIGLSKSLVTRWKAGNGITDATAQKIADYFGITVTDLVGEREANRLKLIAENENAAWVPNQAADDENELDETEIEIRERIRNSFAYRALFDTANGAADSDLLEAAALIQKRKEERGL